MIAIARALMVAPSLLMIDEPALELSPIMVEVVENTIKAIKESGMSVLIAEGNIDLIEDIADTVCVFDHGITVFSGTIAEMMADGNLVSTYLGM